MSEVTCVIDCRNRLGEGARWNARGGAFWWVDIVPPSTLIASSRPPAGTTAGRCRR